MAIRSLEDRAFHGQMASKAAQEPGRYVYGLIFSEAFLLLGLPTYGTEPRFQFEVSRRCLPVQFLIPRNNVTF